MNIKEVLFNHEELSEVQLVEVNGGVLDLEDLNITYDGKTWRDAREYEIDIANKLLNDEVYKEPTQAVGSVDVPDSICWELGYQGRREFVAQEDVYTTGVGIGFSL